MAYKIGYVYPQRIMVTYLYDSIEAEDFVSLTKESFAMMETGTALVHTLSIIAPHTKHPRNPQTIAGLMRSAGNPHPKVGWVIQVTANALHRFVGTWSVQLVVKNARYHAVETPRQALCFLKDRDTTLESLDVDAVLDYFETWKPVTPEPHR